MNLTTQPPSQVSTAAWIGVVASIGIAVAGAAAAHTYLREPNATAPSVAPSVAPAECWDVVGAAARALVDR